jgi:hypothetical protein
MGTTINMEIIISILPLIPILNTLTSTPMQRSLTATTIVILMSTMRKMALTTMAST